MSAKDKSLFATTLNRWSETNVIFNKDQVLEWATRKPETEDAQAVLEWATAHPYINIVRTEIPEGIIDGEHKFAINDIKVTPPKVKKGKGGFRVMDDDVYDMFEHVRTYVPRGLTILEKIPAKKNEKPVYSIVVYAMKKFTGGPGDEDEEEDEEEAGGFDLEGGKSKWEYYFIAPHKTSTTIYNTTKENGDSAHLAFFSHLGKTYYIVGSKNVHMLIGKASDIAKYSESRFTIASLMGKKFLEFIEKMDPQRRDNFIKYMLTNNLTATFEFLQVEHQHIELFDFPESKFRFIAFTFNDRLTELCSDLEQGSKVAKEAGWETTAMQKYTIEEQDAVYQDIRFNTFGKEGSVLYYVNGEGRIIGMMKKKTIWYILVRAIREKTKALIGSVTARVKKGTPVDKDKTLAQFDTYLYSSSHS